MAETPPELNDDPHIVDRPIKSDPEAWRQDYARINKVVLKNGLETLSSDDQNKWRNYQQRITDGFGPKQTESQPSGPLSKEKYREFLELSNAQITGKRENGEDFSVADLQKLEKLRQRVKENPSSLYDVWRAEIP